MQTINIWHKHHIHWRKIILAVFVFFPAFVFSQRNVMENDLKFARKPYHFGIHLAAGLGDFKIKQNELFASSDSILSIKSKYGMSFEIGALMSFHINKYVELRTIPSFVFAQKQIVYDYADLTTKELKPALSQIYFDLPLEIKVKSEPLKDIKLYLIAGLKYGYDIGGNFKDRKKPGIPKQLAHDFGVNYGAGIEIHFPLFILSPEFRMYNSVINIHKQDNTIPESRFIKGLYNRSYTFSLNFEG